MGKRPPKEMELLFPEEGGGRGVAGAPKAPTPARLATSQALLCWVALLAGGRAVEAGHTPARHWGSRRWGAGRTQEGCVRTPSPGEAQQCPRTTPPPANSHLLGIVSAGPGAAELCLWAHCPGLPQVGTCLRTFAKSMREAPGSDLRWPRTAAD